MIRFPKRPIKTDRLDDADILESEVVEECIATSELQAIELDDADLLLTPASAEPEGVRNVMASLEAEVSRVLGDDRSVLGPRSKVRSAASLAEEVAATPHAPSVRPKSVPAPASVPPTSQRSAPPSSSHTIPLGSPLGSSPFVVAQHVVVPASGAVLPASAPSAGLPKPEPQIVVVREKPAFAWAVACLALGALGAVVGMRVANGFSKPIPPPVAVALPQPPAPPATQAPSVVLAAPPSPEALLSATTAPTAAPPTVVAFDEKDTVHVVATPFVPPQAPVAPLQPAATPAIPQPAAKASTSAKPGDPPPLLPDAPAKPLAATPPPPPPPSKPARVKTPEEQLLEAQLKAATK